MGFDIFLVCVGLVVLVFAGDILVRGAVALAIRVGLSPLIVSLTVVALGTSAPELVVAVQSALEGKPGLAFGNVVGSNIANVLLVLGIPAIIFPLMSNGQDSTRSYVSMVMATVLFIVACSLGELTPTHGILFLILLVLILIDSIRTSKSADLDEFDTNIGIKRTWALTLGGLILLPLGAEALIRGAVGLAKDFGLSEAVIGLTIIAIGTSLPELATTVAAAIRRQADVAIGNVIGSNLFNLLAIMGVASLFGPLPVPETFMSFDVWIMLAAALILAPFLFRNIAIGRTMGVAWTVLYLIYIGMLL